MPNHRADVPTRTGKIDAVPDLESHTHVVEGEAVGGSSRFEGSEAVGGGETVQSVEATEPDPDQPVETPETDSEQSERTYQPESDWSVAHNGGSDWSVVRGSSTNSVSSDVETGRSEASSFAASSMSTDREAVVEPVETVEPVEGTEVEQVDPVEGIESVEVEQVEPVEGIESVEPIDRAEDLEPVDQVENGVVVDSSEVVESEQAVEPVEPVEPSEPESADTTPIPTYRDDYTPSQSSYAYTEPRTPSVSPDPNTLPGSTAAPILLGDADDAHDPAIHTPTDLTSDTENPQSSVSPMDDSHHNLQASSVAQPGILLPVNLTTIRSILECRNLARRDEYRSYAAVKRMTRIGGSASWLTFFAIVLLAYNFFTQIPSDLGYLYLMLIVGGFAFWNFLAAAMMRLSNYKYLSHHLMNRGKSTGVIPLAIGYAISGLYLVGIAGLLILSIVLSISKAITEGLSVQSSVFHAPSSSLMFNDAMSVMPLLLLLFAAVDLSYSMAFNIFDRRQVLKMKGERPLMELFTSKVVRVLPD